MTLVFVPPGGGEADYSLDFDLPGVPQPGDYISVTRPDEEGTANFIVRRTWWSLNYPVGARASLTKDTTETGICTGLVVECEFALSPYSTEAHKRACESYRNTNKLKEFEDTAF